ncbi:hypothetical protein FPQ18DRAFT_311126 [Pyronema domesticum]|nr:hypothetical protein FPQ18DRAFT_311126 [Pyronema domesticum]
MALDYAQTCEITCIKCLVSHHFRLIIIINFSLQALALASLSFLLTPPKYILLEAHKTFHTSDCAKLQGYGVLFVPKVPVEKPGLCTFSSAVRWRIFTQRPQQSACATTPSRFCAVMERLHEQSYVVEQFRRSRPDLNPEESPNALVRTTLEQETKPHLGTHAGC